METYELSSGIVSGTDIVPDSRGYIELSEKDTAWDKFGLIGLEYANDLNKRILQLMYKDVHPETKDPLDTE